MSWGVYIKDIEDLIDKEFLVVFLHPKGGLRGHTWVFIFE